MVVESLDRYEYSLQIAHLKNISGDYRQMPPFVIKNLGEEAIELEVCMVSEPEDYIKTTFDPGWNPELIVAVKDAENLQIGW